MNRMDEIIGRLDRIIEILELQIFVPEGAEPKCQHEKARDMGVMGMRPGERMSCPDCGEQFSRLEGEING